MLQLCIRKSKRMEVVGYLASGLIGITLGLTGGGGSILTMPVLVYLFHVEPSLATAYSLFIVGTTALVGSVQRAVKQTIDFKTAIVFAVPSFIAVYLTRSILVPIIPHDLFSIGDLLVTKDMAIMIVFAIIMVASAFSMIRSKESKGYVTEVEEFNYAMIILDGVIVGIITGIVGAGGGFIIIPALVLFARLPMRKAVGTSLLIIAVNSLVGFAGDVRSGQPIDFHFLLIISMIAMGGVFVGNYFSIRLDEKRLKSGFGWFVLLMGVYIILKETLFA